MKKILLVAGILFISALINNAKADIGPNGGNYPNGIITSGDKIEDIEMTYEKVVFDIKPFNKNLSIEETKFYSNVTATFDMTNNSDISKKLDIIFPVPCGFELGDANAQEICKNTAKSMDFRVEINGENQNFDFEYFRLSKETWAFFGGMESLSEDVNSTGIGFSYNFDPKKVTQVKISYNQSLVSVHSSFTNIMYIMETGSNWSGKIGSGEIIFNFPFDLTEGLFLDLDERYKIDKNQLIWEFEDLEPTINDNISVKFNTYDHQFWEKRQSFIKSFNSSDNYGLYNFDRNFTLNNKEYSYQHLLQNGLSPLNLLSYKDGLSKFNFDNKDQYYQFDYGWITSTKQTPSLYYEFDGNYPIKNIQISSIFFLDYASIHPDSEIYLFNDILARPKTIKFTFDDGTTENVVIEDTKDKEISLTLKEKITSSLKIEFIDFYDNVIGKNEFMGLSNFYLNVGNKAETDTSQTIDNQNNESESIEPINLSQKISTKIVILLFLLLLGLVGGGFIVYKIMLFISKKRTNSTEINRVDQSYNQNQPNKSS